MPFARTHHHLALASLGTLIAAAFSPMAYAQDAAYPYLGLSLGQSNASHTEQGIVARQLGTQAVTVTGISADRHDTAYKVALGYQFNRYMALEASFFHLGKSSVTATTTPAGTLSNEFRVQGGGLDAVGTLPLSERFSLLGRVGGQYAKTRATANATGAVTVVNPTPSSRQFNYKFGAGVQYAVSPGFLVRAEGEQYRVRDAFDGHARIRVYSISAVFPFGGGAGSSRRALTPAQYTQPMAMTTPAQAPMLAPVVVAALPAAQPRPLSEPAPAAVAPALRRVSFSAESLFGFDQSAIQPAGRTKLDVFAREVVGTQFEVIVIEGHADRLGSTAYNQHLSLQRADAVKAYLVATGGLDASKITSAGMGEGAPTTRLDDCKDSLPTAALRSCLQPDRRVDVVVQGTKP